MDRRGIRPSTRQPRGGPSRSRRRHRLCRLCRRGRLAPPSSSRATRAPRRSRLDPDLRIARLGLVAPRPAPVPGASSSSSRGRRPRRRPRPGRRDGRSSSLQARAISRSRVTKGKTQTSPRDAACSSSIALERRVHPAAESARRRGGPPRAAGSATRYVSTGTTRATRQSGAGVPSLVSDGIVRRASFVWFVAIPAATRISQTVPPSPSRTKSSP